MKDILELKDSTDLYLKDKKYYDSIIEGVSAKGYLFFLESYNWWSKKQNCSVLNKMHEQEKIYFDGPEFKYFINEYGFRSKSFSEFDLNNINVLFLGCSITQGVGLPEECMWAKKLVDKIQNDMPDKQIDYYNLSIAGGGIHLAIKNLITFLNTVGKPDYIFVYFPQISRSIIWNDENYISVLLPNKIEKRLNEQEEFLENYNVENTLLYTTTLIHMMELICNLSGIKLIWSTWYNEQMKTIKKVGFNNYFELNINTLDYYAEPIEISKHRGHYTDDYNYQYKYHLKRINKSNINNEPYWSSARDGWHFGTSFHTQVAEKFYIEFKSKYKN